LLHPTSTFATSGTSTFTTHALTSVPPLVDHEDGEPKAEGLGASGIVHMTVDIPDSPELIVISSDDEEELEPEEEIKHEEEMDEKD